MKLRIQEAPGSIYVCLLSVSCKVADLWLADSQVAFEVVRSGYDTQRAERMWRLHNLVL